MAKPRPSLTCCNAGCARPLAGAVDFCPFCGRSQPVAAAASRKAEPPVSTATAPAAPVPPLPVDRSPPPVPAPAPAAPAATTAAAAAAPTFVARPRTSKPASPPPPPPSPPGPQATAAAAPPPRAPRRSGSRLPLALGALVIGAVCTMVFLRSGTPADDLDGTRFEQWRAAVERCLRDKDVACADAQLANLRQHAPVAYWTDLQQRTQQAREQQDKDAQRVADAKQRKQELEQQAIEAKAAEQARAQQMADADAAAELAVRTPPVYNAPRIPDRPARLDESSQQRAPVRYPRDALRSGQGGSVLLNINVDATGTAMDVSVYRSSGNRMLDRAAQDAARRWRYEPAIVNGLPAQGFLQKQISFEPEPGNDDRYAPAPSASSAGQELPLLDKARRELRAGRFDVAMALGESALQINPDSRQARDLVQQARNERDRVMRETTIE